MEKYINVKAGKKNFLRFVKDEVQENFGDAGIQTYVESIKKLNIREDSSKHEVEKLVSEIEKSLANSKAFCNGLRQKLTVYDKFSPIFWNFLSDKKKTEDLKVSNEGLVREGLGDKILELLYQNYDSGYILKDLNIQEETLADIIIYLDNKGLIINKNKNWILTEKGKDIFEKRANLFKKLKIEYLRGEINNRDEYNIRKKELEDLPQIIYTYEIKRELEVTLQTKTKQ